MRIRNFTPAITTMSDEVLKIAGEQPAYFRTQKFHDLMYENERLLLDLIGCKNGRAIFLTCSGSGAMDAAVSNLIREKKTLIINGGSFGERWKEICEFYNIKYKEFKPEFGKNINFESLEREFQEFSPTKVLMQATETSSTQRFDVKRAGELCSKYNSDLIVDAISSFVIDKYNMDDYNVSASVISSQKGLNLAPGLSMIVLNKNLIEKQKFNKRNYYLDFEKYLKDYKDIVLPFTPNILVFKQLNYRLKQIKEKGIDNIILEVNNRANHFRELIKDLPLEIIPETPSNCGTLLRTERTDVKDFFRYLQEKGIYFTPSGGEEGKIFCIGHIGDLTKEDNLILLEELKKWLI